MSDVQIIHYNEWDMIFFLQNYQNILHLIAKSSKWRLDLVGYLGQIQMETENFRKKIVASCKWSENQVTKFITKRSHLQCCLQLMPISACTSVWRIYYPHICYLHAFVGKSSWSHVFWFLIFISTKPIKRKILRWYQNKNIPIIKVMIYNIKSA